MAIFIQRDNFDRVSGTWETIVLNRVKEGLGQRNILGQPRYPLFNMSANGIRNLILKLLKEFNIATNSFKVYLKAEMIINIVKSK